MKQQDLRSQALQLALAEAGQPATGDRAQVEALIATWLDSIEDEDLAGIAPQSLASPLWEGFSRLAKWTPQEGCRIEQLPYADGRGGQGTALLILNEDMPFLVDSMVLALRKLRVPSRAVLNAVLSVQRAADGSVAGVARVGNGGAPAESWVLCLLAEQPGLADLDTLLANIRMAANDAATVRHDAAALRAKLSEVAAGAVAQAGGADDQEVAAFLEWAKNGGFELFGYARYQVQAGQRELVRTPGSALGVLEDRNHPVYGDCLAGIPGDFDTLAARKDTLSVVKADVQSTLHRDQQLDFIGVRHVNAQGAILGEYCFVGLFTRAATATPLARLPFARGRIAKVLSIAGVRQEGFRAEKFVEILESLPRTEALEAEPEWLAEVCGAVVSLYKQPRTKVFARRDVYARHLNVLVYLPRERYSASVASALAKALQGSSGATHISSQTLVADGPLARVYLIAHAARYPLDLETDIQQPLLAVLDGWHDQFAALADAVFDVPMRTSLRKLCATLPADYVAS
ncbi:MAG TPA: glutamate dehydrogenase, partial [Burkholderiaceae bacterium]|nr:glutamate dehydrogenase [Burkholderiaceae bacterium]